MSFSQLRIISSVAPAVGADAVTALSKPGRAKCINADREDYKLTLLLRPLPSL
jgi:hypothetical protein